MRTSGVPRTWWRICEACLPLCLDLPLRLCAALFSVQKAVEEHCNLRMVLRCCLLLASFLLATILLQSVFPASQLLSSFSTGGMLFLLFLPALVLAPMAPHPGYSFLGSGRAATGAGRAKSSEHLPAIAEEDSGSEASSSTSRGRTQGTPPPEELRPAEREVPELAEAPQALPGAETAGPRPSLPGEAAEAEHTAGPSRFGRGLSMMAHGLGKSSLVGHVLKPSPFEEERRGMRHSRSLHTGVAQRRRWATADTGSFSQRLLRNQFLRQPQQQPQQLQHDLVGDANGLSREQSVADFGEHESYGVPEIVHGAGDPEEQGEAGGDWGFYFNEDDSSLRANRPFDFPPKSLSEALSWKLGAGALEGLEGDALEAGEGEPSVSGGLKEPLLAPSAHGGPRAAAPKRGPALGGDHTFGQALGTLDFWLMYAGLIAGFGSGLAAISNLAQIGESLGYNGNIQVRPQIRPSCEERITVLPITVDCLTCLLPRVGVLQAMGSPGLGSAGVHIAPQRLAVPGAAGKWLCLRVSHQVGFVCQKLPEEKSSLRQVGRHVQ